MPSRNIQLLVRAVGARAAARDMTMVSRATANVGRSSRRSAGEMGLLASSMGKARQASASLALGMGVVGAAAVKVGFKYNAMMEQQKIAFTSFLGSASAAEDYLGRLYKLAAVTPFEFPDLVKGTRTMLAYGMASEDTMKTMTLLADAIASAPTEDTANQIARTSRALGQVQAAGILHAQDLNQLVDAGVTSVPKLAKSMGMSVKDFRKQMALGKMDAGKFFKAQRELWEKDPIYSGMASKQQETFYGRLSTLHDYAVQTMGGVTESLFKSVTDNVMPGLIDFTTKTNEIWKQQDLPLEEKMSRTRDIASKIFNPLLDQFEVWWKREEVTQRIQHAFWGAVWTGIKGGGKGLWFLLKSAFTQLWEGDWAARLTVGALMLKLGLKSKILRSLGKKVWQSAWGGKGKGGVLDLKSATGVMNVQAGVVNVNGVGGGVPGGGPGGGKGKEGWLKRGLKFVWRNKALAATHFGIPGLIAAGTAWSGKNAYEQYQRQRQRDGQTTRLDRDMEYESQPHVKAFTRGGQRPVGDPRGWDRHSAGQMQQTLGHMASGGITGRSGYYTVGEHGRESVYLPRGSHVKPDGGQVLNAHITLEVDGRVLASTVHRQAVKSASTR